ncbi:hypothetical protein B0H14DRAFT_2859545 [Mycena olivaceomarginata]|nr:hypothetical protein B0H14DRAFT_2859545 [Mycena olivaceomarginata]
MPWAQLTDISPPQRACTRLVWAEVVTHGWSILPQARAKMLVFNHLRALSITFMGMGPHVMPFLRYVCAPALDGLSLYFETGDGLQWDDATFTEFQLRAALFHASSLTHLSLADCPNSIDDALIRALCYTEGVPPLVPHLHSLTLTNMSESRVSAEVLTSTIASRLWTDGELALRSKPPAVARWRKIELEGAGEVFSRLGQNFQDAIDGLQTGRVVEMEG